MRHALSHREARSWPGCALAGVQPAVGARVHSRAGRKTHGRLQKASILSFQFFSEGIR
jgi:hypothetical protein